MLITPSTFVDFGIPCAPIASISRLGLFGTSTNPPVQSASPRGAPFVRNRTKFVSDRSEHLWFHQNPDADRSPSAESFRPQIHTLVEPIVLSNYVFRSSKSVQPLLSYRRFRFCTQLSLFATCFSFGPIAGPSLHRFACSSLRLTRVNAPVRLVVAARVCDQPLSLYSAFCVPALLYCSRSLLCSLSE